MCARYNLNISKTYNHKIHMKITDVETLELVEARTSVPSKEEMEKPYVPIYIPYPEHTAKVTMGREGGLKPLS